MMKRNKLTIQQLLTDFFALSTQFPEIIIRPKKWHSLLLVLVSLICVLHLDAQNFGTRNRIPTPNDNLVSFEGNNDGSATLRLYAPDSKSVELSGETSKPKGSQEMTRIFLLRKSLNK